MIKRVRKTINDLLHLNLLMENRHANKLQCRNHSKNKHVSHLHIYYEVVRVIIFELECAEDFARLSKLDEICQLSSEIWFAEVKVLLKEP